jgi:nucleotide-binding universal stress UspA family protein
MDNAEIDPTATPWRILVPVEHNTAGAAAFDLATALAAALRAELVLLGLSSRALAPAPWPAALATAPEELTAERDATEAMLTQRIVETSGRVPAGVSWRAIYGWLPAGPAIVDAAREVAADLVVVSMRRGSELSHLLRDGVDRHVIHHSPVPVLVVPEL